MISKVGRGVKAMRALLCATTNGAIFLAAFVLCLALAQGSRCYAQAQAQPQSQVQLAKASQPDNASSEEPALVGAKGRGLPEGPTPAPDPEISPAVAKELAAMKAEIEQLKTELKSRSAAEPEPAATPESSIKATGLVPKTTKAESAVAVEQAAADAAAKSEKPEPSVPFAYADWTWLNGTARNKDAVWDSKFFTPEIRFDTNFVSSFNHPQDDTIGGFERNLPVERSPTGTDQLWRRLPLAKCSRPGLDHGRDVRRHDATE